MSRGSALQTSASSTPQTSRSGSRRVLKPVTEGAGLQSEPAVGDGHRYTARGGTLRSADRLWPHRAAQNVRPHAASRTLFAAHHLVHVGAWFRHPLLGDGCYVGLAFAQTGWLYPLFGPLIGWLGVALTGSDTSSTDRELARHRVLEPLITRVIWVRACEGVRERLHDLSSDMPVVCRIIAMPQRVRTPTRPPLRPALVRLRPRNGNGRRGKCGH